jgi:hypothetical protein
MCGGITTSHFKTEGSWEQRAEEDKYMDWRKMKVVHT